METSTELERTHEVPSGMEPAAADLHAVAVLREATLRVSSHLDRAVRSCTPALIDGITVEAGQLEALLSEVRANEDLLPSTRFFVGHGLEELHSVLSALSARLARSYELQREPR